MAIPEFAETVSFAGVSGNRLVKGALNPRLASLSRYGEGVRMQRTGRFYLEPAGFLFIRVARALAISEGPCFSM
jgi:hypothetical protein